MSAVLAFIGTAVQGMPDPEIRGMLATMSYRGSEETATWRSSEAVLATSRDRWELDPGFAGPTLIASRGPFHVICDATLYYKEDLKSRLRGAGVEPVSDAAADLIAAAYAAFGANCVDYIEGDFAFCVWDERERTLFCARDPFGTRSLFHMEWEGGHWIASTPHALVQRQGERAAFDRDGILRALLFQDGAGTATAWHGIQELPAGYHLTVTGRGTRLSRFWIAKGSDQWSRLDTDTAAEALSQLLDETCRERQHQSGTSLAMSGGMDSPSVLAALAHSGRAATCGPIHILSLKYPPGDSGNEDWYVNLAADSFNLPVHWIDTAEIGLFDDLEARAQMRSGAVTGILEGQNRALANRALELGDRVILNGHGADNLFWVGDWKMGDLLRTGRWLQLRRYFTSRGYRGWRNFRDHCVRPATPFWVMDAAEMLLGRAICSRPFEIPPAAWIRADEKVLSRIRTADRADFAASILRHQRTNLGRYRTWGVMYSGFHRICSSLFDSNRDEGVELRMPFYDRRLVEFAMSRPADDLNQPKQYKILLGQAMRGKLPDRTREPQKDGRKSGTATDYVEARFGPEVSAFKVMLEQWDWVTEELGVVDRELFLKTIEDPETSVPGSRIAYSLTLFVENWLQVQSARQLGS